MGRSTANKESFKDGLILDHKISWYSFNPVNIDEKLFRKANHKSISWKTQTVRSTVTFSISTIRLLQSTIQLMLKGIFDLMVAKISAGCHVMYVNETKKFLFCNILEK